MMPIKFVEAQLSADESVKQREATKQMQELLHILSNGVKYATLSVADRKMLLQKGFAKDLVDNLVFFTERTCDDIRNKEQDHLVVGFTHAAFDPSIYACDSIASALMQSHDGRCAYCESQIDHISPKHISHFRPVWGAIEGSNLNRQAYYSLAYEQTNLVYACETCNEVYKGSQFPVEGLRAPRISLMREQALLINPYQEDPRQYVRFNPITAEAYAYDDLAKYCVEKLDIVESEVESLLWENPKLIPSTIVSPIASSELDNSSQIHDYHRWLQQLERSSNVTKGDITINVLGLNRPELLRARLKHLREIYGVFLAQEKSDESDLPAIQNFLNSLENGHSGSHAYRSLTIDAISSWQKNCDANIPWFSNYTDLLESYSSSSTVNVSPQFSSSLQYMVLETELKLEGKRRIVCLHSSDYLYGSDRKAKTVFLPIDWKKDFSNVIKVSSEKLLWEASFAELCETRPVALQSLFANNEVWAEGNYPALA